MVGFTSRIVGNGHAFMPSKEVVHPQSMMLSETLDPKLVGRVPHKVNIELVELRTPLPGAMLWAEEIPIMLIKS